VAIKKSYQIFYLLEKLSNPLKMHIFILKKYIKLISIFLTKLGKNIYKINSKKNQKINTKTGLQCPKNNQKTFFPPPHYKQSKIQIIKYRFRKKKKLNSS